MKNKRLVGLDFFRILSAIVVFMFHTRIFTGCHYGTIDSFASSGGLFMTGFFMLSGYSLYYTSQYKDLNDLKEMAGFYKKRLVSILPLYLLVMIVYHVVWGEFGVKQLLMIVPMDALGLRSTLLYQDNLQFIWFVSNILICYLIYPFIQNLVKQLRTRHKLVLLAGLLVILLYAQVFQNAFATSITVYYSLFYRILEFAMGILAVSLKEPVSDFLKYKLLFTWKFFFVELLALAAGLHILVQYNQTMLCQMYVTPMFLLMLWTLSGCENRVVEKSKVFQYIGACTYAFYLAQIWTLRFCEKNLAEVMAGCSNWERMLIVWGSTVVLTILLHELVEKPCTKWLSRKK